MKVYLLGNTALLIIGAVIIYFTLPLASPTAIGLALGSSIIAGGVIGFAYYAYYRRERRYDLVEKLVDEWGLWDIQEGRGKAEEDRYEELLVRCDNKLHIQAISLTRFQGDFDYLINRLGSQGVEIQLLLMDPDSDICSWYGNADRERGGLETQIRDSIEELRDRDIDTMEVRVYSDIPLNYFRIDDKSFVGPYFTTRHSRNSITFLTDVDKGIAEGFRENFEDRWEGARVVID